MAGRILDADFMSLAERIPGASDSSADEAALRRAISTAYYGLFHAVCRLCAETLVGGHGLSGGYRETFTPMYRSVEHDTAKKFFDKCRKQSKDGSTPLGPTVRRFAEVFVKLQEERHVADYSPEPFDRDRNSAFDSIAEARHALSLINAFNTDERYLIAVGLFAKSRR
jgi:hypothetical protein